MCMCMWLHEPMCAHGDQEKVLGVPLYHSLPILFEAESLPESGACSFLARLDASKLKVTLLHLSPSELLFNHTCFFL